MKSIPSLKLVLQRTDVEILLNSTSERRPRAKRRAVPSLEMLSPILTVLEKVISMRAI